jgi:uncharacterized membrane protein YkvA (DUF1232 family)
VTTRPTVLIPADDPPADGQPLARGTPRSGHASSAGHAPPTGEPGQARPAAASGTVHDPGAVGTDDGFPRAAFGTLLRRLPRYLRLAWGLAGEPSLPRVRRAGVLAAAAYLASPVDLVPGIVPVVGQLDDVAIVILALRAALRALDEPTRLRVLGEAGLTSADLDDDLTTVGLIARWLARRGAALTGRLLGLAARAAIAAGRTGARVGARVGSRAAARATRAGADAARRGGEVGVGVARRGGEAAVQGASAVGAEVGRQTSAVASTALRRVSAAGATAARGAGSVVGGTRATAGRLGNALRRGSRSAEPDQLPSDGSRGLP